MTSILKILSLVGASLLSSSILAQDVFDAINFSSGYPIGTARYTAMGGAFSALGGDGSAVSINPAGAAVFLNNQFDVSLGVSNLVSNGNGFNENKLAPSIPALNVIFTSPIPESPWKTINFALITNRQVDLNRAIVTNGSAEVGSSMADFFVNQANGFFPDELEVEAPFGSLGYQAFVIDPRPTDSTLYTANAIGDSEQRIQIEQNGKISDFEFAIGGNYDNKLYIGVNLGFSTLTLEEEFINTEDFSANTTPQDAAVNTLRFSDFQERVGSALFIKLGAIYRLNKNLRVSAYYHSPKNYRVSTNYRANLEATFSDGGTESSNLNFPQYTYRHHTPQKYGIGMAYILNQNAVFSIEGERTEIANTNFAFLGAGFGAADKSFYNDENLFIASHFNPLYTFRAGLEFKIEQLSLRAGYQYQTTEISAKDNEFLASRASFLSPRKTISGGIGYRFSNFSVDGFLSIGSFNTTYSPYSGAELIQVKESLFSMGAGMSFFF